MTRAWRIALAGLVLLVPGSARAEADITGEWLAYNGRLTLVGLAGGDYKGTYVGNGTLSLRGQLEGQRFVGHWSAPHAPKACVEKRFDSRYWGSIQFVFDSAFQRFTGHWSYCDETRLSGDWVGERAGIGPKAAPKALPPFALAALQAAEAHEAGTCTAGERYALALHGGAVYNRRSDQSLKLAFIEALLESGQGQLAGGATALDAVETAIRAMEDSGLFNAGRGAIANKAGDVELDASIMDGRERRAGAVAAVRRVRNPVSAARLVMERSKHVLMVGAPADRFIAELGGATVEPDYFIKSDQAALAAVPLPDDLAIAVPGPTLSAGLAAFSGQWHGRWDGALDLILAVERLTPAGAEIVYAHGAYPDWGLRVGGWIRMPAELRDGRLHFGFHNGAHEDFSVSALDDGRLRITYHNKTSGLRGQTTLTRRAEPSEARAEPEERGTVGAVALDRCGDLAAGTSTGGFGSKTPGRVGDSPIIGAGTYADNATAAVSATGHGEYFIRYAVAHEITAMMRYGGLSLEGAARELIERRLPETGLTGGIIALDRAGNVAMPFNTPGMVRGAVGSDRAPQVALD